MATSNGSLCIQCEKKIVRPDSHYCSVACRDAWMLVMDGPVTCACCSLEQDTVSEAKAAGWTDIEEDSEGIHWNYSGVCPECQKDPYNFS